MYGRLPLQLKSNQYNVASENFVFEFDRGRDAPAIKLEREILETKSGNRGVAALYFVDPCDARKEKGYGDCRASLLHARDDKKKRVTAPAHA